MQSRGVLLHEMWHHYHHGLEYADRCEEREREAYQVQAAYLRDQGVVLHKHHVALGVSMSCHPEQTAERMLLWWDDERLK